MEEAILEQVASEIRNYQVGFYQNREFDGKIVAK